MALGAISDSGSIIAPNVEGRYANLLEILYQLKDNRNSYQDELSLVNNNLPLDDVIYEEFFESLFSIPTTEAHSLMQTLAQWKILTGEDVTQGQTIVGFGHVSSDGSIALVEDIEALTRAAMKSNPDALIVPLAAY
jgi:hypothetical protein